MDSRLAALIDRFHQLRVLVIGDPMLDSYLEGAARRLSREAPVPIVAISERRDAPGGAANAAVNVRHLGAHVAFLGVVGADREGGLLRRMLEAVGVATDHLLVQPGRTTLAKHRVIAGGQVLVRFDHGATVDVAAEIEERLVDSLAALFPRVDAVIVSDYGYGVLTPRMIEALGKLQSVAPRTVVVDAKDLRAYRRVGATAVKPNYGEAARLLGISELERSECRVGQILASGHRLLDLTGARMCAVTIDTDGALLFERDAPTYRTYARPSPHSRAAGAGDTFVSALALALAAGGESPACAELASAAAAVVVEQDGTVACTQQALREHLSMDEKYISNLDRLLARLDLHRQQGHRVVFTNGCFDILHRGHVTYLSRAKALGDVLVVGVNGDESVRRLKGEERPINSLEDRAQVLAALSCVDYIVSFNEDTPEHLVRAIRPDVFTKGGDYTRETLPEAALVESLGGRVEILPYLGDRSTTRIIERIREVDAIPPAVLAERRPGDHARSLGRRRTNPVR